MNGQQVMLESTVVEDMLGEILMRLLDKHGGAIDFSGSAADYWKELGAPESISPTELERAIDSSKSKGKVSAPLASRSLGSVEHRYLYLRKPRAR